MYLTTIRETDVRWGLLRREGKSIYVGNAIGQVQPRDVGKRVYSIDGVVQVENDRQMQDRLNKRG